VEGTVGGGGRPPRWAAGGALALLLLAAGCRAGATGTAPPLAGLVRSPVEGAASPLIAGVIDTRALQPVSSTWAVYHAPALGVRPALTVTRVSYAEPKGARMLFNGLFAERTFVSSAERRAVALGAEAEAVDNGWPPLHLLSVRDGNRYVLVEAADTLAADRRAMWLEALARHWLAGEAAGP
jgi:hypothetical protein